MKEIKELVDNIQEEIEDAEKYAKAALKNKETDRETAQLYCELAKQELHHSELLHSQVVRVIKAFRSAGHEPPAVMLAIWEWEHEKIIEKSARVKQMLEMYKVD